MRRYPSNIAPHLPSTSHRRGARGLLALAALLLLGLGCGSGETGVAPPGTQLPDPERGLGEECLASDECRDGLKCDDEQMVCVGARDTAEGDPCELSVSCLEGLFCDAATSTCQPSGEAQAGDRCASDAECAPGLRCQVRGLGGTCAAEGEGDVGASCASPLDCRAGLGCAVNPADPEAATCQPGLAGIPQLYQGRDCAEEDTGPFRLYFELPSSNESGEFYRLPFPNDVLLDGDDHPDLSAHPTPGSEAFGFDLVARYAEAAARDQDRWGTNAAVLMRFSGRADLDSLKAPMGGEPRVYLIDITADSPSYNQRPGLNWYASTGRGKYICQNWLAIRPNWGRPLRPNTTYAAIVTTDVRGEEQQEPTQDDDLKTMLSADAPGGELKAAWDRYQPLRDWLVDQEIEPSTIANAAVFSTGDPLLVSQTLREAVEDETISQDDWIQCQGEETMSPCAGEMSAGPRSCRPASDAFEELHTRLSMPIFQSGEAPYADEGGRLNIDAQGSVSATGRSPVCLSMTVPKQQQMPAEGWPLVIYAHGTGGYYNSHIGQIAQDFSQFNYEGAPSGVVVIGWDQIHHGPRKMGSELGADALVYNWPNPDAARGNFWQAASEIYSVLKWSRTLDIPAAMSPTGEAIKINPEKIYFMGHSQGATSGPLALPFAREIKASVLSGSGGGLILSLLNKTQPYDVPGAVALGLHETASIDSYHPVLNILQAFFEPVDPINYGRYIGARTLEDDRSQPMHVFHLFGVGDNYTPDPAQKALTDAMDTVYISPVVEDLGRGISVLPAPLSGNLDGRSVLGRQYAPEDYDGHFVTFRNPQAQDDLAEFLGSAIQNTVPEIKD